MDNVKFAELVAKTGIHFGAVDGNYDDKEKAFVNMFIAFLKFNGGVEAEVEDVIRKAGEKTYTLNELVDETKALLADLPEAERKGTLESFANFIETVICADGKKELRESWEFDDWKKALLQ